VTPRAGSLLVLSVLATPRGTAVLRALLLYDPVENYFMGYLTLRETL